MGHVFYAMHKSCTLKYAWEWVISVWMSCKVAVIFGLI